MIVVADAEGLASAVTVLRSGGVCAFPTETVYGLGANAYSATAISEIYRLKGRPGWNPLIVHVADTATARALSSQWPDVADELAHQFWPGPMTLVVQRDPKLPGAVSAGTSTVAIRVPAHPVAQSLLEASGLPLAAPSANRSECLSPTCAAHVAQGLPEVPLILDGGQCPLGIESTVVDVTDWPPRLLRPGALSVAEVRKVVGVLDLPGGGTSLREGVRSPGMGLRHYAPTAETLLLPVLNDATLMSLPGPVGALTYVESAAVARCCVRVELLPDYAAGYGAGLFAALHRLDAAGVRTIAVMAPPEGDDWLGVQDRLRRAATKPISGHSEGDACL